MAGVERGQEFLLQVEAEAAAILGERAYEVLHDPRAALGPPWSKDHRMALAATILAV